MRLRTFSQVGIRLSPLAFSEVAAGRDVPVVLRFASPGAAFAFGLRQMVAAPRSDRTVVLTVGPTPQMWLRRGDSAPAPSPNTPLYASGDCGASTG